LFETLPQMTTWIEKTLREKISIAHLEVKDMTGEDKNFHALVVSADFEGQSMVNQHQIVYKALGEAMKERIHALALKTYTPEIWNKNK